MVKEVYNFTAKQTAFFLSTFPQPIIFIFFLFKN